MAATEGGDECGGPYANSEVRAVKAAGARREGTTIAEVARQVGEYHILLFLRARHEVIPASQQRPSISLLPRQQSARDISAYWLPHDFGPALSLWPLHHHLTF